MSTLEDSEVLIESLANSGDGVGRINNKVVFVPYTAPKDLVKIRIREDKKTFYIGEVVEIVQASPDRQEPPCEYFGRCGGCQWQHLPYDLQLQWKGQHLRDVLTRVGQLQLPPMVEIVASPSSFQYRNRIQVGFDKQGFYYKQRGSHQRVYIEKCLIAEKAINENWLDLQRQARKLKLKGKVELAWEQDELQVVPVKDDNTTELGFRQVNNQVRDLLVNKLCQVVKEHAAVKIYDLYCGRGYWTRRIAQENPQAEVVGIDSLRQNIKFALRQQEHEPLANLHFLKNKVEDFLGRLDLRNSLCIVDPPRAGLHQKFVKLLVKNPPRYLVYISCHPATQARDLAQLVGQGYQLLEVQGFDMFPQTPQLESWTLLRGTSQ